MKLPHELQPGDSFYFRYSIGEEVKLWKVVATGLNSLIAINENSFVKVPLFYEQLTQTDGHFCYIPPRLGFFAQMLAAFSLRPAQESHSTSPELSWNNLSAQPANGYAAEMS
jgi:hypothetical protein